MTLEGMFEEDNLEEIRLRIGKPLALCYADGEMVEKEIVHRKDLYDVINYLADYSLYAKKAEIAQGFFTAKGGHRVGICGREHLADTMEFGGVNIRVAHERKGCAKNLVAQLWERGKVLSTLFLATCGVGKTTYLRDTIRLLATGDEKNAPIKCAVVDERSELAACYRGIPQNDLGRTVDVLDGCTKESGMRMLLKTMSPQVMAVDELTTKEEAECVYRTILSGVSVLGTVHCASFLELQQKKEFATLYESKAVKRYVLLNRIEGGKRQIIVYDATGNVLWCES